MTSHSDKYLAAAKAYRDHQTPEKKRLKQVSEEILGLLNSGDLEPSLNLLAATKKAVQVGYEEGISPGGVGYFFGDVGFFYTYKNGGKDTKIPLILENNPSDDKVKQIAEAFIKLHKDASFTDYVYGELDKIADACPK